MKRIAGAVVLLTGLSGCISFAPPGGPAGTRGTTELAAAKGGAATGPVLAPTGALASATANVPGPVVPQWSNGTLPARPAGDYVAARPNLTPAPGPGMGPRPTQMPALLPIPQPQTAAAQQPLTIMPGMPMVVTPRGKEAVPVSYSSDQPSDAVVTASRTEAPSGRPRPMVAVPPTPVVKNSLPDESKPQAGNRATGPLFRMVNTKRITLNFEVKDVGPSGLSGVELWYTQDAKDWKKYDAPAQAQAYVVEVDEEGMYGFTLVAKSGTGIGKDPPQPGDQPQVWVIVDLTRPDVKLAEVTPSSKPDQQQTVTVRWKATDKNLGRQPISLFYAEKEEGPWNVIATGLENNGRYLWQVPKGTPARVLVRIEATDMAGNVGRAQLTKVVVMDNARPKVSIVNVEASAGN